MDRRDFLKSAGLGAAALGIAACAPKTASSNGNPSAQADGKMPQHFPGLGLLGYGCMRWPTYSGEDGKNHIDQEKVNAMVDYALEHGINYFDTSPVYLEGDSERATAEALNRHPREEWLLATKLSNFSNFTYENSVLMYRKSLETFKTDHIDYYLLHSIPDLNGFNQRFGETGIMDFLLKEREEGHIRHLGFSFHGSRSGFDDLMKLHDKYHWDFVQIQMNYVDWNVDAEYLYEELTKRSIPVVIMEPLLGGQLSSVPAAIADEFKKREPSKSIASWAFRFFKSFPNVQIVLSGMTYMEHLQDNVDTFTTLPAYTEEELSFVCEMGRRIKQYPLVGCTGCQYCMPCPYGINIPGIFRFYNNSVNQGTYVASKEQEHYAKARRKFLLAYDEAIPTVRQADHCIQCRQCEPHCPQHIRIPRELRRIDEYIESLKRETL